MRSLREMLGGRDVWWGIVVLIVLVNVCGMAWFSLITGKDLKIIEVVLLQFFSTLTTLVAFRYGSSKGSKEKDKQNTTNNNNGE